MVSTTQNLMTLWSWPWLAGRLASDLAETAVSTQRVLATRLPMLATAFATPLLADHRELALMVGEKVDAFGTSRDRATSALERTARASRANVQAAGRMAGGGVLWPADWIRLAEVNVSAFAALAMMPGAMLAPLHRGVTANDRRLHRGR